MGLNRHPVLGVRVSLTTGGLVAVIAVLVLGIFGTHGLTPHGSVPGHGSHQPVLTTTDELTGPSALHQAAGHLAVAVASVAVAVAGDQVAPGVQDGSLAHMAMLCAAMLLAAAVSALLALRLRRLAQATLTHLNPLAHVLTTTLRTGRVGTGPPPVLEFSVIRC